MPPPASTPTALGPTHTHPLTGSQGNRTHERGKLLKISLYLYLSLSTHTHTHTRLGLGGGYSGWDGRDMRFTLSLMLVLLRSVCVFLDLYIYIGFFELYIFITQTYLYSSYVIGNEKLNFSLIVYGIASR